MAVTQTCFNTRVADIACLNVHARITRRGGHRRLECLIIRVGPIPRSGQSQVVPQPGVNTDFPSFGTLRVKLLDRTERRRQPLLVRFVVRIGRSGQEPREGDAHGRKGCSQLEVSKCFGHIESCGRQPGKAHRGVEERTLRRSGQLRGPVVTSRHGQIKHRFVAHFD